MMDIRLDLSRHCIETELKRRHESAVLDYFKADEERRKQLEPALELMRHALETLDFRLLRSRHPALAGGSDREVILSGSGDKLVITVDGVTL